MEIIFLFFLFSPALFRMRKVPVFMESEAQMRKKQKMKNFFSCFSGP